MSKVQEALREIHHIDTSSQKDTFLTAVHPCVKFIVTLVYLVLLVSFGTYNLSGILGMSIYLILLYNMGDISIKETFSKLKEIFFILLLVGAANLFLDRRIVAHWGNLAVTGGVFSFLTLYIKGLFALLASYALIVTTGMENLCYALQVFHLPGILITVILLIYRYLILFIKEVDRMSLAYQMRAPGQKGIHIRVWGSMVGSMLLRSVDRSEIVYESMQLRGFSDRLKLKMRGRVSRKRSVMYGTGMILLIVILRLWQM